MLGQWAYVFENVQNNCNEQFRVGQEKRPMKWTQTFTPIGGLYIYNNDSGDYVLKEEAEEHITELMCALEYACQSYPDIKGLYVSRKDKGKASNGLLPSIDILNWRVKNDH